MFDKLKADIKNTGPDTVRADKDDYFEIVMKRESAGAVMDILKGALGEPVFPSRNKLSKEAEKSVSGFGGIRPGQTLYFLKDDSSMMFAMLWPWQDGERVTLKMGKAGGAG